MKIKKIIFILSVVVLITALASLGFYLKKIFLKPAEIVKEEEAKAKVAIIIDDWGYNLRCLSLLRQIDVPVTISILPNLRYSSRIAQEAKSMGKEVILHLPLEPEINERDDIALEKNTITSQMSKDEVIKNFTLALNSVPYISGVSNHMGSRATKDDKLMAIIFAELKKRELFFLDNLVTPESICRSKALKMQVKFTSRDIFLDNLNDEEYIRKQFAKLTEFAQDTGRAIGVAHAKPTTFRILQSEIDSMRAKGIEFVFVSDLIE